jgi:hypothetical protein
MIYSLSAVIQPSRHLTWVQLLHILLEIQFHHPVLHFLENKLILKLH